MADKTPRSRPEPKSDPPVYGGTWGEAGKQNETEPKGQRDRPGKIKPSKELRTPGET